MQPDLPWNVAGIPPEAREAARAAARREGLSVGEWLTRRILRGLMEGNPNVESARDFWRHTPNGSHGGTVESHSLNAARDSDDMLARVSRSEAESQDANRRIEEQLRAVARRLEQAERSQSENSRAMSKAAAEINVAAREQAQAFDQLGAHVVGLNDRLTRIEREAATDGLKEAVKALHQGLSRLADQMSQTAHQSASQIASLATNVEQVAGKVIEAKNDLAHVSRTFEDRVGAMEARIRLTERDAQFQADTVERKLAGLDTSDDARKALESELHRQASGLAQLNETLDRLTARFAGTEAQQSGAMARLEENIARLESRNGESVTERRLQGIEHALNDVVSRLEKTEHTNLGAAGTVEESLRSLAQRVDAADKRHREALAELRAAVNEANGRLEVVDPQPSASQPAQVAPPPPLPQPSPAAAPSNFELPPFPDQLNPAFQPATPPFATVAAAMEAPPAFNPGEAFGGHAFGADAFAATATEHAGAAGAESFLAAARRSARAAAESDAEQKSGPFGGFTWGASRTDESEPKSGMARYGLVAVLAFLIIAAVAAGALLSRNLSAPSQVTALPKPVAEVPLKATTTDAPATPALASPSVATPASPVTSAAADFKTSPATATGSPVVPPARTKVASVAREVPLPNATAAPAPTAPAAGTSPAGKTVSPIDRIASLANTGNAKAELLLGLKYLDGDGVSVNEAEAAKWLERAAKQNEALAAYRLGTLYERGHGVPADTAKATQWYAVAAKAGNRKAMHNLAVAYADGNGVQKDLVVAAQWFSRAANLGLADSEFNLAVLYERGMGVQQSLIDAYKWYAIAAQQGDTESKARIEALSTQLSADDKAAAQKAAASFHADAPERTANMPPDPTLVLGG